MGSALFVILVLVVGVVVAINRALPRVKPWQQTVANRLHLQMERILSLVSPGWRLRGTVDGLDMLIEFRDTAESGTRVSVEVRGSIPPTLVLKSEGAWQQLEKAALGADIETGDSEFDLKVSVRGTTAQALAVLTEPARKAVAQLTGTVGGRISDGAVRYEADLAVMGSTPLVILVRLMLSVARFLGLAQDGIAPRLRSNAALDPDPGVRLRNLMALGRDFRGSELALEAAETALADPDKLLRLFGALAIAAEPSDTHTAERLDRAITTLAELREAPAGSTLVDLLGHESLEVAWAAATALGFVGSVAEVEPLRARAHGLLTDSRLKEAVEKAVGRIQARLGDVQPGRLSLAEEDAPAGGLTLADESAETGALDLVVTERNESKNR